MCNTAKYRFEAHYDDAQLHRLLLCALHKIVPLHASLCCGIIDEHTTNPYFIKLREINLRRCIEFFAAEEDEEQDINLLRSLAFQHSQLWAEIDRRPGWKVLVVPNRHVIQGTEVDLVFAFHHGCLDGMSSVAFHYALLQTFRAGGLDGENDDVIAVCERERMLQ